ncbi:MAG: divergent PAP2 family protein [Oscillospiraceae bacterium]|nr:divergent PAP2 family protein [Oscillospiraceae bacterium]
MNFLKALTVNYYINVMLTAWFLAQLSKTLLTLFFEKKLVLERMVGAGGMPSSHSALVCSLTIAIAKKAGVQSAEFALAMALACIVMYDAMGVRRAAGEHAKVLNKLVFGFQMFSEESETPLDDHIADDLGDKTLKEYLGHTPLEVLGGMLLGILVSMLFPVT